MPFIRYVENIAKWDNTDPPEWLSADDICAEVLPHLKTKEGQLSIFEIDGARLRINRIHAAQIAIQTKEMKTLEFLIFDEQLLADLGVKYKKTKGGFADNEVNSWHIDIVELSAKRLVNLAIGLQRFANPERILRPQLHQILADAVRKSWLKDDAIKYAGLRSELKPLLAPDRPAS